MRWQLLLITILLVGCTQSSDGLSTNNSSYKDLIVNGFSFGENPYDFDLKAKIGVTSHHLPTAVNFIGDYYEALYSADKNRNLFVVVGPDHTEKCKGYVSVGDRGYNTGFGYLSAPTTLVKQFVDAGVSYDPDCFAKEHSIGVQADFIKYVFPEAEMVPIVVSSSANEVDLEPLVKVIRDNFDQITVVVSVDFNHYKTADVANIYDAQTLQYIRDLEADSITLNHVDSPPSLRFAFMLAKEVGFDSSVILDNTNSHYLGGSFDNTTSYMNVVFE